MKAEFTKYLDVNYSLGIMNHLIALKSNPDVGYRTSGSAAELAAGDFLYDELKRIGMKNVRKELVTVDNFEFKRGDLTFTDAEGNEHKALLAAYQANCHAENETIRIVYVGKGRDVDYEGKDVKGKFVLIDIDMMGDWWMNWPLMQARFKGAAGMIMVNVAGYCSYSEDTLGAQDISGPADMPALSMTVKDANVLKAVMAKNGGEAEGVLNADVSIRNGGVTCDVIAEIPGAVPEYVYLIGHYDAYFTAFEDNTSGIGCIMGILRAFLLSGYKPRRTLRVCFHGAEEWGIENTRYDWARGATMLVRNHPEWGKDGFLLCNLDGNMTCSTATGIKARTPYEMVRGMEKIGAGIEGSIYPFGTNSPLWTWTESYMYAMLGIPTIESFYEGVDFWGSYHSTSDQREINGYSDEAYLSSHILYGTLVQKFDELPVRPLDFTDLFAKLEASIDDGVMGDTSGLRFALAGANEAAKRLNGKEAAFAELSEDAVRFNEKVSRVFAKVTNELFGLDWYETYDFIHARNRNNVGALTRAIADLKEGKVAEALDEELRTVDLNWHGYNFDKQTYDFIVDQVLAPDAVDTWARGKVQTHADLWQVCRDLWAIRRGEKGDLAGDIGKLEIELARQRGEMGMKVVREIDILKELASMMDAC